MIFGTVLLTIPEKWGGDRCLPSLPVPTGALAQLICN